MRSSVLAPASFDDHALMTETIVGRRTGQVFGLDICCACRACPSETDLCGERVGEMNVARSCSTVDVGFVNRNPSGSKME